jgi:hypothetical protein
MEGHMSHKLMHKSASLAGSGGETEFEQAFSSLAYAYLRDKAPRLLDHMLGFQLVDRNEDNTKAIGIFGFQLGNQWLYAPVFFLNGDLKGHELLYMKNNDSFVPLKENWVNYIMSRKPHVLGEPSARKLRDLGGIYPDIRTLSIPPSVGGGKRASDATWVKDIMPLLAAFKVKAANSLYRGETGKKLNQAEIVADPYAAALAKHASILDLNKFIPQSFAALQCAHALSERYPLIKQGMQKFYGSDCFSRWGNEIKEKIATEDASIFSTKTAKAKPYMPGNLLIPTERPAAPVDHIKEGKLRLYVSEFVIENRIPIGERGVENSRDVRQDEGPASVDSSRLSQTDRETMLRDNQLIQDAREDGQTSRVFNVQVESRLFNPTTTGLYRVLEKPGEFNKMLVATHGTSNRGREPFITVVRLENNGSGGGKAWLNSYSTNVFADQIAERDEWDEWFAGLEDAGSLQEGSEYIGVDPYGSTTVPFHVQSNYGENRYRVDFRTHVDFAENRKPTTPHLKKRYDPYTEESYHLPSPYGAMLYINKEGARGTKVRAIAGELRVPPSFKFLKLSGPQEPQSGEIMPMCNYYGRSDMPPIQLGKIDDIQLMFYEKTAALNLANTGTHVHINSVLGETQLTKNAAVWNLVSVHGLREKTARELLKEAERKHRISYRIEYAPGYGNQKQAAPNSSILAHGPTAPIYDDYADERSVEQYGPSTAVPTQFAATSAYRLADLSANQTDPGVWNPWQNFEAQDFQKNVQTAQQASQQGQKEVFDTAMISGMLKSVRQDSLVEKHLAALMGALDSLGRLLMNFYWHQEEFEDRYGKSDLPELEDGLRNSFESLGDITLFLKEKTIESPFNQGDVSIEETARN